MIINWRPERGLGLLEAVKLISQDLLTIIRHPPY
jgi:hypothetical protein